MCQIYYDDDDIKGTGNDKQGKDAGNRTLCPYRSFSQAIISSYCLTKISIRAKRSISRVFSLFIVPSPFFVHCPYKGRINRAESVLTGLKPY